MKLTKLFFATFFITLLTFKSALAFGDPEVLNIGLKTSKYMQLDRKITRVAVGNPDVATVKQLGDSPNEFLIVTHAAGSTSLFVWTIPDIMHEYIINVSPEDTGLAKIIKNAIGIPTVQVKVVDTRILLTGIVRNQYERNKAVQTARLYAGGKGSQSSLSVGSGIDMKVNTQSATSSGNEIVITNGTIGGSELQDKGEVIDLLHMLYPTQIRLEAQVIAIRPQDKQEIGIKYGNDPLNAPGIFSIDEITKTTAEYIFDAAGELIATNERSRRTWAHGDINASISALVTQQRAKILSRPSITTMSGEEAIIQVGGEIPYTARSNEGWSTQFKNYGIILQLKPVVDAEDRVTSTIHAEVSNMSGETVDGQPILDIRRADSVITLHSGSTMVIGGLMDSSESKTINKFPILGDIPIIGEFFKYTSKSKDKQELIILVTPYIVEDEELSQAKMSDSMKELYNQGREEQNNLNTIDLDDISSEEVDEPFKN